MAKSFIESVRGFQYAFKHPVGSKIHALAETPQRKALRGSWLQEELDELTNATTLVDKVDAIIDFQYFLSGNLVEMGFPHAKWCYVYNKLNGYKRGSLSCSDLFYDGMYRRKLKGLPKRTYKDKCRQDVELDYIMKIQDQLDIWMDVDTVNDELKQIYILQRLIVDLSIELGIDYKEYQACFDAVHNANMMKLWEDGKPHYNEFGKVKKPEGWEQYAPEKVIREILNG